MKTKTPLPFLELFTIGMTAWTGFIFAALFILRFSNLMLQHQLLELLIFGPAAIMLIGFIVYQLRVRRRH